MFDSFEFDRKDAVDLWKILEPVITKFHGDAEKGNMLLLFTKVWAFSFARDVKERFKARIKNWKVDR